MLAQVTQEIIKEEKKHAWNRLLHSVVWDCELILACFLLYGEFALDEIIGVLFNHFQFPSVKIRIFQHRSSLFVVLFNACVTRKLKLFSYFSISQVETKFACIVLNSELCIFDVLFFIATKIFSPCGNF